MRRLFYILLVAFIVERSSSQTPLLIKEQNVYAYNKNVFNKYSRVFPCIEQDAFSSNKQKNAILNDSSHIKQRIAKNTIYFELLGNGFLYTLNYDRIFFIETQKFSCRVGFIYFPSEVFTGPKYAVPVELNFLIGTKNLYEGGLGLTYAYGYTSSKKYISRTQPIFVEDFSEAIYLFIKPIAYRIQMETNGVFFRISGLFFYKLLEMNPNYNPSNKYENLILNLISSQNQNFGLSIGISIGYSF